MKKRTGYFLLIGMVCSSLFLATATARAQAQGVTVSEDASSFTMSNGVITARVLKRNGDLISLIYKNIETLTDKSGHAGAYWSHDASSPEQIHRISIDPKTNNGERAEVSVKGISNGRKMGRPAGSQPDGDFPADIEIRWSLGRNDTGVYTYSILEHKPDYPAGSIGEARFCAKLAATFDWMSIDDRHNKLYAREIPGEDKYVYTANQFVNRAYGFSSTTDKIGWYIINPTTEYLSGGPTKVEFLCHRDTTQVEAPCVLNYWRSSHYGGAVLPVSEGEQWSKVVGPFFIYVNSGAEPEKLFEDAKAQARKESAKWPYDWVQDESYPTSKDRATVRGQIVIDDPIMPSAKMTGKLMVGLTHAPYLMTVAGAATQREVNWQTDGKYYQSWGIFDGTTGVFSIDDVRPGNYTLHAFADGILGEFAQADVTIEKGKNRDLGKVIWKPIRHGRQLWQVGIPNRTATEFAGGDNYWDPETKIKYAKLFPDDVTYTIGRSEPGKDWYYEHIPHNIDPEARVAPFSGVVAKPGNATPYRIVFDLAEQPRGQGVLRFAFCSTSTRQLSVTVNDREAGIVGSLPGESTITRHGIQGIWYERDLSFDASMLRKGTNTVTLTVPAGSVNNGIIYDAVRLELNDAGQQGA
jgi:rhamnogalacturonan endolyase